MEDVALCSSSVINCIFVFKQNGTTAVLILVITTSFSFCQYAGKWYAQQKKDPEGLFLQDNISAEYTIGEDGAMTASSKGRVTLFGWVRNKINTSTA